jgi:hypothetical protein
MRALAGGTGVEVEVAMATTALASSSLAPSLTIRRARNSASSEGSVGRGCQTVDSLRSPMYFSSMPRWLM